MVIFKTRVQALETSNQKQHTTLDEKITSYQNKTQVEAQLISYPDTTS